LDLSPEAKEIKAKINKQDRIKLKSFCAAKETTEKMKRQISEWEKMFANDMTNKGLNIPQKKEKKKKGRRLEQTCSQRGWLPEKDAQLC